MEGYDPRTSWKKTEDKERERHRQLETRLGVLHVKSTGHGTFPAPTPNSHFDGIPVFFEDIIYPNTIPDKNDWPQAIYMRFFPTAPMLIQPVSIGLIDKHYNKLPEIAKPEYVVAPTLRFRNVKEATEQKLKVVQNIAKICAANPVKTILIIFYRPVDVADSTIVKYATTHIKPLLESPPSMEATIEASTSAAKVSAADVNERTFDEMIAEAMAADAAALSAAAPKAAGGGGRPPTGMKKFRKTRRRNTGRRH